MTYFIFLVLGFGLFWAGLKLFDDEVILIASAIVGSVCIFSGLAMSPPFVQIPIEAALILALFNLCMECIKRGNLPKK